MALRIGAAPSEAGWALFGRAFYSASGSLEHRNPVDPFEESRRLEEGPSLEERIRRECMEFLGGLGFTVLFLIVVYLTSLGLGYYIVGALTAVAFVALALVVRRGVSAVLTLHRTHSQRSSPAVSRLVRQARRGTFNGLNVHPHALTFAKALYRREQAALELENRLPLEMEIAHDVRLRLGTKTTLTRTNEFEVRAVNPIVFSGLDSSTPEAQKKNRFLGAVLDQVEASGTLTVGHVISTRGGVVVADIKVWEGLLKRTSKGTIVSENLGLEELSRHRSINALAESARFVNDGDVSLVLVIVIGGTVDGGKIETRMKGRRVVVAQWEEAVETLLLLDAKRSVTPAQSIESILENTPEAHGEQ